MVQYVHIPGFKATTSCTTCQLSDDIVLFKAKFEKHVTIVKQFKNFLWRKISVDILNSDLSSYLESIYHLKNQHILKMKYLMN